MLYLAAYFVLVNISALIVYYSDKNNALKKQYRTSEKHLLVMSLLGGFIGALIAIYKFRHKNKKTSFMIPFWITSSISIVVFVTLVIELKIFQW